MAFGFAAALTIVGSSISYYEFVRIGATTNELVSRSLPATIFSLELAEEASTLVSSAPRLMAARDDAARSEISKRIARQAGKLSEDIEGLKAAGITISNELIDAQRALLARLQELDETVTERLADYGRAS